MSNIDHPKHYNSNPSGIECIDIIENLDFNIGNAIKYIWRCEHKNNFQEDIQKAIWYTNREIERRKQFKFIEKLINRYCKYDNLIDMVNIIGIGSLFNDKNLYGAFANLYSSQINNNKNNTEQLKKAIKFLENI